MMDWISGTASASLPRNAASIIAATGAKRDPVASQTAPASAISEVAAAKSPLHTVSHSHTVQKERELVERADVTGELNLPDGHAPALVVPESFVRHRGDKAPPEYLFLGDVLGW